MKRILLLILVVILPFLFSCTDNNNVINNYTFKRTLVLISDFEPESELVLGIRGDIRSNFKDVELVYLHSKKFDIYEGAYLFQTAMNYFPSDAYYAIIVDPGTDVYKFYTESGNRKIFAPDNGITTLALDGKEISNTYKFDDLSNFSGFDNIFKVPFATLYRQGIKKMLQNDNPNSFGSPLISPVKLDLVKPEAIGDSVVGQVLYVDNFGNCITNIISNHMSKYAYGDLIEASVNNHKVILKVGEDYGSVPVSLNVTVYDDARRLNLAVNYGNFSSRYGVVAGDKIVIKKAKVKIGVLRYNESDLTGNIIKEMKQELSRLGFIENNNTEYFIGNANSDKSKFPSMIKEMVEKGVDIFVPVSTPASQAALQSVPLDIPILYTYVTSPEFAGLVGKRNLMTGISDATNFEDYLNFVKDLFPNLSKAGRIYNGSEPNSEFAQQELVQLAPFFNLSFSNKNISGTEQIQTAFNSLSNEKITTILIAADNTLNLGMKQLADLSAESKISLIGDSKENVIDGALAAISVDYHELAKVTGSTVFDILLGKNPDTINIIRLRTSSVAINKITASKIGFSFPSSIVQKAEFIIE